MEKALIFGFGSHFRKSKLANDIDLLILHDTIKSESVDHAISVKKALNKKLTPCDFVILSKKEEQEKNFILISESRFLGKIEKASFLKDLKKITLLIKNF